VLKDDNICYIHKIAFQKYIIEEPVPFAGIIKFVEYKCPVCQTTPDYIEEYTIE
jgi:hypothetical protein